MCKTTVTFASGLSCEAEVIFQEEPRNPEPPTVHLGRGIYSASGTVEISGNGLDTLIFDVLYPEREGVTKWQ